MFNENLMKIVNNDILLSLVLGIVCTLIIYFENKRTKTEYSNINYAKNIVFISFIVYGALYLKNTKIPIKESSIKTGEPDF